MRKSCVLISTIISVEYDKSKFGEANRAETIAQYLEDAVRKTTGVKVVKWRALHSSVAE